MKVIRTVKAHQALTFGDEGEDQVRVDHTGVLVSEADAKTYSDRADELGVEVEVVAEDEAPEAPKAGEQQPLGPGADTPAARTGTLLGSGGDADTDNQED